MVAECVHGYCWCRFIIVACDGLWKRFDNDSAVEFVHKILQVQHHTCVYTVQVHHDTCVYTVQVQHHTCVYIVQVHHDTCVYTVQVDRDTQN